MEERFLEAIAYNLDWADKQPNDALRLRHMANGIIEFAVFLLRREELHFTPDQAARFEALEARYLASVPSPFPTAERGE